MHIEVLDKGYVALRHYMGTDLSVVNSARASFAASTDVMRPKDEKLIGFMAEHRHSSPFRHAYFTVEFKAPLFVARQLHKHQVGIEIEYGPEYGAPQFSGGFNVDWNEWSGRYIEFREEVYVPDVWRGQSASNRQASEGQLPYDMQTEATEKFDEAMRVVFDTYRFLLSLGVAKEQARMVLTQNIYTVWWWTMSLQAALHLVELRDKPDAQWETQCYGKAVRTILDELFPVSSEKWNA